ncbi:putative cuticle collagen 155 isoform X2 [Mya arenaria]|uniref:putative cuticle collagen 155 isoform X2 n=1 Tax=Mya arenaria TaxID=6604 RepID=UPI0022DED59E|nr:putative cuticle collagen 155 isoform X2 [Mya arenaria]
MELRILVVFRVFLIILVLFSLGVEINEARGGRGGGGSRGGSRSGSRTSRTGSSTSTRMYRGPSYSRGSWKTAAAVGVVYGLMSYRTRSLYLRYPNREPTICFNEKNLKNETYGYFICPDKTQADSFDKCCGSSDEQRCCNLKDYQAQKKTESIAGIVVGVIIACVAIAVFVYCCIIKRRRRAAAAAKAGIVITKPDEPENRKMLSCNEPGMIPLNSYSDQPQPPMPPPGGMMPPPPGGMMPPPQGAYNSGGQGLPYSMSPAGANEYPPPEPYPPGQMQGQGPIGFEEGKGPLPNADVSEGPCPYPSNPNQGPYPPPSGKGPLPNAEVSEGPCPYPSNPTQGPYPPFSGGFTTEAGISGGPQPYPYDPNQGYHPPPTGPATSVPSAPPPPYSV